MSRSSRAILVALILVPTAAYGQSLARVNLAKVGTYISEPKVEANDERSERVVAARAIEALKRLDQDVLIYRSLGDFEENGKLARVSFEVFQRDLEEVSAEVGLLLARLPQTKLKTELSNAVDSYRDGAFWWQKIDQPRVVHVSALTSTDVTPTASDAAFFSTVPYTVAIHWRQAARYLKRAEETMNETRK